MAGMIVRTERNFGEQEKLRLLEAIRQCRKECILAQQGAGPGTDIHRAAFGVAQAIDALADLLTGDVNYFQKAPARK